MKGVYLHIPFCNKKCNYCGFHSVTNTKIIKSYLLALEKEVQFKKNKFSNFFKKKGKYSLFIGGGNPALLSISQIKSVFKIINNLGINFSEATIEANPDSITNDKLISWKDFGINRVSIGLQALNDNILNFLGRNHNLKQAFLAIEKTEKIFSNFSIDLIGGIPVITRDLKGEILHIMKCSIPHISFYLLSLEKGSSFYKKICIDEEQQKSDYETFCYAIKDYCYRHYEISNFSKKGYECIHNKLYWERKEYIGFGPTAVSYLNNGKKEVRLKNPKINEYMQNPEKYSLETLKNEDIFLESIFLPLRTKKGVNLENIKNNFPDEFEKFINNAKTLINAGVLTKNKQYLSIREKHFLLNNEIVLRLVSGINL